MRATSLDNLEKEHEDLLNSNYHQVLERKLTVIDGTTEKIKSLCANHGVILNQEEAKGATGLYSLEYAKRRRAIPGSKDLLEYLKPLVKTGIITDGLTTVQTEKIRVCEVGDLIDFVVASEEVGCTKPNREIFEAALRRVRARPAETVCVGNSWNSDIVPAHEFGIKTIWLNRYRLKCPDPVVTTEINSYAGLDYHELFL